MPATPERIAFIEQPYRSAVWESEDVRTWYGKVARDTKDEPFTSFFDEVTDAQRYVNERGFLLGSHARRFRTTIDGILLEDQIDLSQTMPGVQLIDDELVADMIAAVAAIESVDFDNERTILNTWGLVGMPPSAIASGAGGASGSSGGEATDQSARIHSGAGSASGQGGSNVHGQFQTISAAAGAAAGGGDAAGASSIGGDGAGAGSGSGGASGSGGSVAAGAGSSAGGGTATSTNDFNAVLREDGSYLLREDGSKILRE